MQYNLFCFCNSAQYLLNPDAFLNKVIFRLPDWIREIKEEFHNLYVKDERVHQIFTELIDSSLQGLQQELKFDFQIYENLIQNPQKIIMSLAFDKSTEILYKIYRF